MSLGGLMRETVTIHSQTEGTADVFGDAAEVFADTDYPAFVGPARGNEDTIDRDTRITPYQIILPAGTTVKATDEVTWNGKRMRIVGRPLSAQTHHGEHHVEVFAEYIEG